MGESTEAPMAGAALSSTAAIEGRQAGKQLAPVGDIASGLGVGGDDYHACSSHRLTVVVI